MKQTKRNSIDKLITEKEYSRQSKAERDADTKAHDNSLARIRYGLRLSKKETRKKYETMSKKDKKGIGKLFRETQDLDIIETFKAQGKKSKQTRAAKGDYLTEDEMLLARGWRPEIAQTEFGLRARMRVDQIMSFCRKMPGPDWIRPRPQK